MYYYNKLNRDLTPILYRILELKEKDELDLTPTELGFYFTHLEKELNKDNSENFLEFYESILLKSGLGGIINFAYDLNEIETRTRSILKDLPIINYYKEINIDTDTYSINPYISIEEFWIRTDRNSISPFLVDGEGEAYARVWVERDRLYIFGCDDYSYSFYSDSEEEIKSLAKRLKTIAPVWNFAYKSFIHPQLEFTN